MLADISCFSSLMERDETRTFSRIRSLREHLINPKVAEHGGRIIKTTGDGFLADFASSTAALKCGIEIQRLNHSQQSSNPKPQGNLRDRPRLFGNMSAFSHCASTFPCRVALASP